MDELKITLKNCYGIKSLEQQFDFTTGTNDKSRVYAIYAPNGVMKTSFSKTFDALSKGESPKEERYNHTTTCVVNTDNIVIQQNSIYVLKAELDVSSDSNSVTNILVNPENKVRYDELLIDLDKLKSKLLKGLCNVSGLKQSELEETVLNDWQEINFEECIKKATEVEIEEDLNLYKYNIIFDSKALAVLQSTEFTAKADEFNRRYQELFEQQGSIYQKGVFNPNKAETSFNTLSKQGFFAGGHRVHLKGDDSSITKEELDEKLKTIHANIDGDSDLKKIKKGLAKNTQTDALAGLIEMLSASQFEFLLDNLKQENQNQFRINLWASYIQSNADANFYLDTYEQSKVEIENIETDAAQSAPRWDRAVELFNDRFVDMPFKLTIPNQVQAVLGRQTAKLSFIFKDDPNFRLRSRDSVRTSLSLGERRALYLLNFIFDVEERIMNSTETLFILDDVADSFDYKNKHAIIQYLRDLTNVEFFHQIVLTHNFDFFRALSQGNGGFVHRSRCLMTTKSIDEIWLSVAEGVSNYFVNKWKRNVMSCRRVLYATIPFTRNLIEYTSENYKVDQGYLKLTSLLHWKQGSPEITVGEYLEIYNQIFNTTHNVDNTDIAINLLLEEAQNICSQTTRSGLDLEDKVVLSIATRMKSEKFLTERLRQIKNEPDYWYPNSPNQYRGLLDEYKSHTSDVHEARILEKVGITVNSNIHLNSFMYEPILDLTIEHLVELFREVDSLNV